MPATRSHTHTFIHVHVQTDIHIVQTHKYTFHVYIRFMCTRHPEIHTEACVAMRMHPGLPEWCVHQHDGLAASEAHGRVCLHSSILFFMYVECACIMYDSRVSMHACMMFFMYVQNDA